MVTSDGKLSKNKKDTIYKIQPYGDDDDYWLQAENDQVAAVLASMPKNVWLIVKAHGDRDSAYLEMTDVDGNPLTSLDQAVEATAPTQPAPPPPAAPAQPKQLPHQPTGIKPPAEGPPAPPSTSEQPAAPTQPHPGLTPEQNIAQAIQDKQDALDSDMLDCLNRAHEICTRFAALHEGLWPTDMVQRMGVTLFIEKH